MRFISTIFLPDVPVSSSVSVVTQFEPNLRNASGCNCKLADVIKRNMIIRSEKIGGGGGRW